MTEEEIINQCEAAFQKGGPRVYVFHPTEKGGHILPSSYTAKLTLALAYDGQQVWARRKVSGRREYRWRVAHKVTG